jgi:hypothetical protein
MKSSSIIKVGQSKSSLEYDISKNMRFIDIKESIIRELSNDLLKSTYKEDSNLNRSSTYGHCYAASEAFYYLAGGKDNWIPQQGLCPVFGSHWWLKNRNDGTLVDVTDEQFYSYNLEPPYSSGVGRGFQKQSLRSIEIISRVLKKLNISIAD